MDFNYSSGEESSGWESEDFITKYTTKSTTMPHSPRIENGSFRNSSLGSDAGHYTNMRHEEVFCTKENFESRLVYLNQEMTFLGFPSVLVKTVDGSHDNLVLNFDPVKLINCTHELLKMQQQSTKRRSDLEERQMRSESDYDALFQNQSRLKEDLEVTKREECRLRLRETQLQEKIRKLQLELKNEKEEVKKMKSDQQQKYKQFIHEGKRKEKEMMRLKDRLHQLLTDNKVDKTKGIMISNALTRGDGKRGTWKGINREGEDMYKVMLASYEERNKELLNENTHLRDYLAELLNEYISLLKEQYGSADETETDTKLDNIKPELLKGHFAMPFEIVKEDIQSNFKVAFQVLRERLEQGSSKGSTPANRSPQNDEEKEQLKQQLDFCKDVIDEQDRLLQDLQEKLSQLVPENQQDAHSPGSIHQLKQRVKLLNQEKENLRLNRKKYTDLVVNLAKEREAFEKEKMEFYKYCISTPVITTASKNSKGQENRSGTRRQLPALTTSTPVFTPAPRDTNNNGAHKPGPKTPSTTELYRFMSMLAEENNDSGSATNMLNDQEENTLIRRRKTSSVKHRSVWSDIEKATDINSSYFESPISHRSKRVSEHAEKIKQAIENHHRSMEEVSPRIYPSEG